MTYRLGRCQTCGARIVWAVTGNNKRMPIDASPREDGDLWLDMVDDRASVPVARRVDLYTAADAPRYVSHFATCPDADQHRR